MDFAIDELRRMRDPAHTAPGTLIRQFGKEFFGPHLTEHQVAQLMSWVVTQLQSWGVRGLNRNERPGAPAPWTAATTTDIVLHFAQNGATKTIALPDLLRCKADQASVPLPELVLRQVFGEELAGCWNYDNFWASVRDQLSCFG